MALRRWSIVVLVASIFASFGAEHRTQNFVVKAPNQEIAQQVGQWAEYYRQVKAIEWVGHEMPPWPKPCPLTVSVTTEGPSGETSFVFHPQGGVQDIDMRIRGPLDRLLASVLPHEITHTVFAYHFRHAVPRWADEGGSVLSEDDRERDRHDKLAREILNRSTQFRLRQLFTLRDYPAGGDKVMCLYAQGFSMSHYLVYISDRATFLRFVGIGMRGNWDQAVQACYNMKSVEELEEKWLQHLRETKGTSITQLTKNKAKDKDKTQGSAVASLATDKQQGPGGTLVRLTAPPVEPLQPVPVYRGAMPGPGQPGQSFGGTQPATRPGYLPDYIPSTAGQPKTSPTGPRPQPSGAIPVQLGAPNLQPPAPVMPQSVSPVGYPR